MKIEGIIQIDLITIPNAATFCISSSGKRIAIATILGSRTIKDVLGK
jgi:hypothetical protein